MISIAMLPEDMATVALYRALVQSCDVYYYNVGLKLGVDRIAKWGKKFGLGAPTGLILDSEKSGLIPSTDWKKQRFHQPWHEGETPSVAIGQGYDLATPLQMVRVAGALSNGGIIYVPTCSGQNCQSGWRSRLPVPTQDCFPVRCLLQRLWKLCAGPAGAWCVREPAKQPGYGLWTSAARPAPLRWFPWAKKPKEKTDKKTEDHAWFVSFAPVENSQIAVAVIIEHGGHGGTTAAPPAREVMREFFQLKAKDSAKTVRIGRLFFPAVAAYQFDKAAAAAVIVLQSFWSFVHQIQESGSCGHQLGLRGARPWLIGPTAVWGCRGRRRSRLWHQKELLRANPGCRRRP